VTDDDIDVLAQVRAGQRVRLHWARPRSAAGAPSQSTPAGPLS
jgi:allophanate hydrolase subunit 2